MRLFLVHLLPVFVTVFGCTYAHAQDLSANEPAMSSLRVVLGTGRLKQDFADRICETVFRQQDESIFFQVQVYPEGTDFLAQPLSQRVSVGEAIRRNQYPLPTGNIRVLSQDYKLDFKSELKYDGKVLKIVRAHLRDGVPVLEIFELTVDPGLEHVDQIKYREMIGTDPKTAIPTGTELICENLVG